MTKLKLHTPDFTEMNIAKIAELFPSCVVEAKDEDGNLTRRIDFDQLRQELSDHVVEGPQERYRLDWPGKREALLAANAPIAKTLRPARDESVDFDTTQNLFIEGDNLDALKLLQENYLGKVKMIYIDPPYNTGSDFIYEDDFVENKEGYFERSNQKDESGRLVANSDSSGRFHSDWLTMIYSRVRNARNLLSSEGIIIVHIDEHEYANIAKLLDETFGNHNALGHLVWDKKNPKGDSTRIATQHENLLIYAKDYFEFKESIELKRPKVNAEKILLKASRIKSKIGRRFIPEDLLDVAKAHQLDINLDDHEIEYDLKAANNEFQSWLRKQDFSAGELAYRFIDEHGHVFRPVSMAWPNKKRAPDEYFIPLKHPITGKDCPIPARGWRNPPQTMKHLLENNQILFGEDENKQPERKYFLKENLSENIPSVIGFGGSDDSLFKELRLHFDNPKPVDFSLNLTKWFTKVDDIILDFFAGSCTTAHAVMQQNAEDDGKRRFIMVQLPEACDEKSEAFKAGYPTIAEIGKERIRRAGKKVKDENATTAANLDTGFRVLKVDSSNVKDIYYRPDTVKQDELDLTVDHIKEDRTDEDLLFQVLLDWGLDLSLPIEAREIRGKTVYFVADNAIAACFATGIDEAFVKELAQAKPLRAVFRDHGFADDAVKINVGEIFKLLSPETEIKTI